MTELSFRVLLGPENLPRVLDREGLAAAYAWPDGVCVRANFVATLDGAVTGSDGLSGSLSNPADRAVFQTLRATCDALVVGAGTARAEDYGPPPPGVPLVIVSRRAALSERLLDCPEVILATGADAPGLAQLRRQLGAERVWELGETEVSAAALRTRLIERGHRRILHEGGPTLVGEWFSAGCIDELCLTTVARLGLPGPRLLGENLPEVAVHPRLLLNETDTLLGVWTVARG